MRLKVTFSLFALASLLLTGQWGALTKQVLAANPDKFMAGNIISDRIFTNGDAMSANQIQQFLEARGSVCLVNFKTLSLHDTNNDGYGDEPYGQGRGEKVLASKLIWQAAQIYNINPKAILVTLQKEQGLITRDDCPSWRYNTALGYGCPDGEPCNDAAYGFTRQIDYGVWHFRGFFDDNLQYVPYTIGKEKIYFHPDLNRCGSTIVTIHNRATAALYSYTPYQPNQAALNAGYGTGNSCSSYGNRNFWLYFSDWFGTPTEPPKYTWAIQSQEAYSDAARSIKISNHTNLVYGDKAYLTVKARNTGNRVWDKSVRIGTSRHENRTSQFCDSSWIACIRPAQMEEDLVIPGEIGTFEFVVSAPGKPGIYKEYFNLLVEGKLWMPRVGMYYQFEVSAPGYHGTGIRRDIYTDQGKAERILPTRLENGSRYFFRYRIKNTGSQAWRNDGPNPVRLGTVNPNNQPSIFCDETWINCNRPATLKENEVKPGEIGTFEFWIKTPYRTNGTLLTDHFSLLLENLEWFDYPRLASRLGFQTSKTKWDVELQTSYTDETKSHLLPTNNLDKGDRVYAVIKAKNTSGVTWSNSGSNPVRLGTIGNKKSIFCDPTWIACTRPATLKENEVKPGEIGTFEFWIKTPSSTPVDKAERFRLLSEMAYWHDDVGLYYHIKTN